MNQDAAEQCIRGAKTAMAGGDWDKALRMLDKAIRLDPDNAVRFVIPSRLLWAPGGCAADGWLMRIMCAVQAEAHVLKMKATSVRAMRLLPRIRQVAP